MRTKIISAFPGTGKTTYHNKYKNTTIDSDSSNFNWIVDENGNKTKNPEFPQNYLTHIRECIGKYEIIFVSSHKEVRDALLNECIFFYLIYPSQDKKEIYLKRYKDRGNNKVFIETINTNWNMWITEMNNIQEDGLKKIIMTSDTLEKEINKL